MPSTVQSAFESCLQEAMDLTRQWVPAWLDQLLTQLRERETLAGHVHDVFPYESSKRFTSQPAQ